MRVACHAPDATATASVGRSSAARARSRALRDGTGWKIASTPLARSASSSCPIVVRTSAASYELRAHRSAASTAGRESVGSTSTPRNDQSVNHAITVTKPAAVRRSARGAAVAGAKPTVFHATARSTPRRRRPSARTPRRRASAIVSCAGESSRTQRCGTHKRVAYVPTHAPTNDESSASTSRTTSGDRPTAVAASAKARDVVHRDVLPLSGARWRRPPIISSIRSESRQPVGQCAGHSVCGLGAGRLRRAHQCGCPASGGAHESGSITATVTNSTLPPDGIGSTRQDTAIFRRASDWIAQLRATPSDHGILIFGRPIADARCNAVAFLERFEAGSGGADTLRGVSTLGGMLGSCGDPDFSGSLTLGALSNGTLTGLAIPRSSANVIVLPGGLLMRSSASTAFHWAQKSCHSHRLRRRIATSFHRPRCQDSCRMADEYLSAS